MIDPSEIKDASEKMMNKNMKFRRFLKMNADGDELDAHFLSLHNELFSTYDCAKCRNCCKEYHAILEDDEIKAISKFLGRDEKSFAEEYTIKTVEGHKIKEKPCRFLYADGRCQIQECRPSSCKDFPFTDKPERLGSLMGVIESSAVCPVVFEILERLKEIYNFR